MKLHFSPQSEPSADELAAELAQIEAESIGWTPLEPGAYLHLGDPNATVIEVVGVLTDGLLRVVGVSIH